MKRSVAAVLALVVWLAGCAPRQEVPRGVRSLRQQRGQDTITVPVWDLDTAEEVAANLRAYARKTLIIQTAYLDPKTPLRASTHQIRFPLRGGGTVVMAEQAVPTWLRTATGAPLKVHAAVHPPREGDAGADGLLLGGLAIDLAHPLELAYLQVDAARGLVARVENYRGEPGTATLEVRFGTLRERREVGPVEPGAVATVEVTFPPQVAGRSWRELPPEARSLSLWFGDGSTVAVDLGKWLEGPMEGLLDWGYTHEGKSTAALVLSADRVAAELERFAALELRSYLHRFTDANIEPHEPGEAAPLPAQPVLVVGTAAHNPLAAELIREAGLEARVRSVGPEGYVLKSLTHEGRPTLLVTSQAPRGVMNGVYGLLIRYGVRTTLGGLRLPPREPFRVLEVDEATAPVFAQRQLVATGPETTWTAQWSQWEWLSLFEAAARNRLNEVVVPLDGLEATFAYTPKRSRDAAFPFQVGVYSCVAEAYLAHERGAALLADVARRRGLDLVFALRGEDGKLRRVAPPECLGKKPADGVGEVIDVLEDPGDFLGLPRAEEAARAVEGLLGAGRAVLAVPAWRGAAVRAGFLAKCAWDRTLTPSEFYRSWAATLCEGEAAEQLAAASVEFDRLDGDILAAAPMPYGLGPGLVLPVEAGDAECDWGRLQARATSKEVAARVEPLKAQGEALRVLQEKLDPIYVELRQALGGAGPVWEDPLFETAASVPRAERVAMRAYTFRSLLGALASVQEGTLAHHAGLSAPAEALPRLNLAAAKYRKARRILLWVARSERWPYLERELLGLADKVQQQAERLAAVLGPAVEAEPVGRVPIPGSDAVVYQFRAPEHDVYAAYKLAGSETMHLRLKVAEARLFHPGEPTTTIQAIGGAFLVSVDAVPVFLVTRRAAWPR